MRRTEVSAYVPCYNCAKYLGVVLSGLEKQTYKPVEIIVVDDGSSQDVKSIAEVHGARYVRHTTNMGLAAARNTGVKASSAEVVASVDADVVAGPSWLETLMKWVDVGYAGAGGKLIEINCATLPDRWRCINMRQYPESQKPLKNVMLAGSNTVFRRDYLGMGYDEKFRTNGEDMDMDRRILAAGGTLVYEPRAVAYHLRSDTYFSVARNIWAWATVDRRSLSSSKSLLVHIARKSGYLVSLAMRNAFEGKLWASGMSLSFIPLFIGFSLEAYRQARAARPGA